MTDLHGKDPSRYEVSALCRLFGVTKQAYYKKRETDNMQTCRQAAEVVAFSQAHRSVDPMIGCRKLWYMYTRDIGRISRRAYEEILASNGLMLRVTRRRMRTTDSTHGLPVYPNLVYSVIPERPCQIWVADITYIRLANPDGSTRFCYLSIVMDAYSRYILGYYIGRTLQTIYSVVALNIALDRSYRLGLDITGLIHHSDRGVQYASEEYVNILKSNNIRISMTENGNPTDNPQAERINSTVKNELLHGLTLTTTNEAMDILPRRIEFYNTQRPHMSIDNLTPYQALTRSGNIRKRWHSYRDEAIAREQKNNEQNFVLCP